MRAFEALKAKVRSLRWRSQGLCPNCGSKMVEVRRVVTYGPDWMLMGKTMKVCHTVAAAEPNNIERGECRGKKS